MISTNPQHSRAGAPARVWRGFRTWRRTRPFWGGLLLLLAGLEIFQSTQASLGGLTFHLGPTGYLSWLIPTILAACGLLLWLTPQQRMFYAIIGAMTAVYSLIAVNLGGFFIGMLLGVVGGALGFAWTPIAPSQPAEAEGHAESGENESAEPPVAYSTVDELMTGPLTDALPQPRNPLREGVDAAPSGSEFTAGPEEVGHKAVGHGAGGHGVPDSPRDHPDAPAGLTDRSASPPPWRNPPAFIITLVVLSVAVVGVVLMPGQPASALTCPPPVVEPTTSATASPPVVEPTSPATVATPTASPDAGLVGGVLGTVTDWATRVVGVPAPTPTSTPASADPAPTPAACSTRTPATGPEAGQPTGSVKQLTVAGDQPVVPEQPSRLTGSTLTMTGLKLEGVTDLPTADGTLRVLKFSMQKAITRDFKLQIPGGGDTSMLIASSALTVDGDVAFYATSFAGWLLGVEVNLTPESPVPPDGIDLAVPLIVFDNPDVQLVFVRCDTLTAPSLDQSFA